MIIRRTGLFSLGRRRVDPPEDEIDDESRYDEGSGSGSGFRLPSTGEITVTPKDIAVGLGAATAGTAAGVGLYKTAKGVGKFVARNPKASKALGKLGAAGVGLGIAGEVVGKYRNYKNSKIDREYYDY